MITYPDKLLPKSHFIIIPQDILMAQPGLCLIRHVESKDAIFLPETEILDPDCINIESGQLADLSTNLLGVFEKDDIRFVIDKETNDKFGYHDLWNGTDNCLLPLEGHYSIDDKRGCFYILVDKLKEDIIPMMNASDGTCQYYHFRILHTPTNCNYWHISIRVYDSQNCEVNKLPISLRKKKNIWRTVKTYLVTSILTREIPNYSTLDIKIYSNESFSC